MKSLSCNVMTFRSGGRFALFSGLLILSLAGEGSSWGAQSVLNSPHNLSAGGGFGKHNVAFTEEKRVCIFCHAPHNANNAGPLWGRSLSQDAGYKPYDSSTLKTNPKPDKPTGASRLCLSCHDGTIALGQFAGSKIKTVAFMPTDSNPTKNPNLTTDLSDDHPISFAYSDALAVYQGELARPASLPGQIKLEKGTVLQCSSCHDPHNNEFGNFLVMSNSVSGSPLCTTCHKNNGWGSASHNPLNTPTLSGGCMNCHYVHNAPRPARLLRNAREEDNCLTTCHTSSSSPVQNVKALFGATMHRHPVDLRTGVHDENETLPAQTYHVECEDCHNPHQANRTGMPLSAPPAINGPLVGVRKDGTGALATKEYEICYKCHSGASAGNFSGISETKPNRVINEPDQAKRFDGANPSFHPVMAQRRGSGASLLSTLQSGMITIYCSSCHNSDQSVAAGGTGASGPHGSNYEHILMARYDMPLPLAPRSSYSAGLYDLCFRCHSESYVMGGSSGFVATSTGINEHAQHVKVRGIPCFACHDPHGVSAGSLPAGTSNNNAHLINFNRDYAASAGCPTPTYDKNLRSCAVSCHTSSNFKRSY